MAHSRSPIPGATDYTGADLKDIVDHLREWAARTSASTALLRDIQRQVDQEPDAFDNPRSITGFIRRFLGVFERLAPEFTRIADEIRGGVSAGHIVALRHLLDAALQEESACIEFKRAHIERSLRSEDKRPLLDRIYEETRSLILDYKDVSNVAARLEALIGSRPLADAPAPPAPSPHSISLAAENDAPTTRDELGFEVYARALARFLLSDRTTPPLTLSIEGPWGSGKSSFLLQLDKALDEHQRRGTGRNASPFPRVRFNAWRHGNEEALWAAFLLAFVEQLRKATPCWRRAWGWVVALGRIRLRGSAAVLEVLRVLTLAGLWLALAVAAWNTTVSSSGPGAESLARALKYLAGDATSDSASSLITTLVKASGVGVVLLAVLALLKVGRELIGNPFQNKLKELLHRPEYETQLPFIERLHEDFHRIVDAYVGRAGRVFVFIDDLDRCDPTSTAAIMKALNFLISGDRRLVFIIAMDRTKIAAALAHQYKDHLPYLVEAEAVEPTRTAAAFGHSYLEKFIQLGFRLPDPSSDALTRFVRSLADPSGSRRSPETTANRDTRQQPKGAVPVNEAAVDRSGGVGGAAPPRSLDRQYVNLGLDGDSSGIQALALIAAEALGANPRRLKQFLSAFRLQAYIAVETGLLDEVDGAAPLTLGQLAKIVAIQMAWPRFIDDWVATPGLVHWLLTYDDTIPASVENPTPPRAWKENYKLLSFLRAEPAPRAIQYQTAAAFDLARVDIRRILAVTSPVPRPPPSESAPLGGDVAQMRSVEAPTASFVRQSRSEAAADGIFQPDERQLREYHAMYENGDVKHLRTVFDRAVAGVSDGETRLLSDAHTYVHRRFVVMSREPVMIGGTRLVILFRGAADALWEAWVYDRKREPDRYELRQFHNMDVSADQLASIRERYRRFLEDGAVAM